MSDKKVGYLLILILLTLFLLVFGKQFFFFQIIQFFLAISWAVIILFIFIFLIGREEKGKTKLKDVFVKINEKLPDFEILKHIEHFDFYFVGGSEKSKILHFQGEKATENNIRNFLEKLGVKKFKII